MDADSAAHIQLWVFPVLFVAGFIAGFVDSIAGGGGLITVPVLLNIGMPAHLALGTNKLQASFGSGSAAFHFAQSKMVSLRDCWLGVVFTAIGSGIGSWFVLGRDPDFLKQFIPILLLFIAAYMIFKPQLGDKDVHQRMRPRVFYIVGGLLLGFYDGFLGPGTGSFWAMAFMLGLGFNLTRATAFTKYMNFASNIASLVVFACAGRVYYMAGLAMGIGQLLGARIGSRMVVARGTQFVRPIFLCMVFALILKLLYDAWLKR